MQAYCFWCQLATNQTRNPLQETVGGNYLHRACRKSMLWIEPYGTPNTPLFPKMKRKSRATTIEK